MYGLSAPWPLGGLLLVVNGVYFVNPYCFHLLSTLSPVLALTKHYNETRRWPNKIQEETEDKYKCVCIMRRQRDGKTDTVKMWKCNRILKNWSGNKQVTTEGFASLFIRADVLGGLKSTSKPGSFYILSGDIQFPSSASLCLPTLRVHKRSLSHCDLTSEALSVPCSNFLIGVLVKGLR